MVKVYKPFNSQSASGRFEDLVYDKRGIVRKYVKPTNPQSQAQGNHRQAILAARRAVRVCGLETEILLRRCRTFRQRKKRQFKAGYWKSYLVGEILSNKKASYHADRQYFNHFTPTEKTKWETAALILGLTIAQVPYASEPPLSGGEQLLLVARAIYRLNIYPQHPFPHQNNAFLWATLISNQPIDPLPPYLETDLEQKDPLPPLFSNILPENPPSAEIPPADTPLKTTEKVIPVESTLVENTNTISNIIEKASTADTNLETKKTDNIIIPDVIEQPINKIKIEPITNKTPIFTKQASNKNNTEIEILPYLPFIILYLPPEVNKTNQPSLIKHSSTNNTTADSLNISNNSQNPYLTPQTYINKKNNPNPNPFPHKNINFARPPNK